MAPEAEYGVGEIRSRLWPRAELQGVRYYLPRRTASQILPWLEAKGFETVASNSRLRAQGPTSGIRCSPAGHDDRNIIGFDCSGLVLYAYAQIGIRLPHLAQDISQHSGGRTIPRDFAQMTPGDTIGFSFAPGGDVFHIGVYIGEGSVIDSDSRGVSIAALTSGYYSRLAWLVVRLVR